MRPILYDENEKSFASMGIGVLADCTSCKATEERNGEYEVELTYPIAGTLYSEIAISRQVLVRPSDGAELQPFRIYKISRPIRGIVTICAQHVRYQMSHIPLLPFSAGSAAECISKIANYAAEECPFEFSTDVAVTATYNQTVPASMLSRLGGVTGSLIDCYGGEWEFDRYKAILHAARGQDRGVVIRYGINLTDLKQEESIADTYTGICPYWKGSDDTVVTLPESVVESEAADKYPYKRTKVVDFSTEWTEKPTEEELRTVAQKYIEDNDVGVPAVSLDLSFVNLADTVEYADRKGLERIHLCDTVTVLFEKLGVETKAKVVKTVYDCLAEKYDKISIGSTIYSLASRVSDMASQIEEDKQEATAWTAKAVQSASEQIRGEHGGNIVTRLNANGDPYELLIMDTDAVKTAQKVWRWNLAGLGYSKDGIDGDYGLAITQDGAIVADYITAGTMSANRIKAGALTSEDGGFVLNLETGELIATKFTLNSGNGTKIDQWGNVSVGNTSVAEYEQSTHPLGMALINGAVQSYYKGEVNWSLTSGQPNPDLCFYGDELEKFTIYARVKGTNLMNAKLSYDRESNLWNFNSTVIRNFKVLDSFNSYTEVTPYTGWCSWYSGSSQVKMYFYCGIMYKWEY